MPFFITLAAATPSQLTGSLERAVPIYKYNRLIFKNSLTRKKHQKKFKIP